MLKHWYQTLTDEAFRLFFSLTAAYAVVAILVWILVLNGTLSPLALHMDTLSWHLHELIYGVSLAAIFGFLFTALPTFLSIPHPPRFLLIALAVCWIVARISTVFEMPVLSCIFHWLMLIGFASWSMPPLFKYHNKGHSSFGFAFSVLMLMRLGFDYAQFTQTSTLPWLHASLLLLMVFIILALGRISFRIVNLHLQKEGSATTFIPRPPMRHIASAMLSLLIISLLTYELSPNSLSTQTLGWISLAAGCSIMNLLNDWRIGRTFFRRYPFMIACIYILMALGFFTLGLAYLELGIALSVGWHLLGVGALGLSLFTVMAIAGRLHSQKELERKLWVNLAVLGLILGALIRGGANLYPQYYTQLLNTSACLWLISFILYSKHFLPLFTNKHP